MKKFLSILTLAPLMVIFQNCSPITTFLSSYTLSNAYQAESFSRLVMRNLPDPDVFYSKENRMFYLTGTKRSHIPIYTSTNGLNFKLLKNINPSRVDREYNYCNIWAPDISAEDGIYKVFFSASRYKKGKKCNGTKDVTTFYFETSDLKRDPRRINLVRIGSVRSHTSPGCISGDCQRTVRIDAESFTDPVSLKKYFFYTWFSRGNHISSVSQSDLSLIHHTYPSQQSDELITEAPDVFKRGKYYYLIFSAGFFSNNYSLRYMYSDKIENLRKGKSAVHTLRLPHSIKSTGKTCDGFNGKKIIDAGGHSSTVRVHDKFYIYYHRNQYKYPNGCHKLDRRHTYRSKLDFMDDGRIRPLKTLMVNWSNLGKNFVYSIDVKLKNKKTIKACKNAGVVKNASSYLLNGKCADGSTLLFNNISHVRVCASDNRWRSSVCSRYTSINKENTYLNLPYEMPLNIKWNRVDANHVYSLDIKYKGKVIAPCLNEKVLNKKNQITLEGSCGKQNIDMRFVSHARVCASNNRWRSATCTKYKSTKNKNLLHFWFEKNH